MILSKPKAEQQHRYHSRMSCLVPPPPSLAVLLAAVAMMVATLAVHGVTAQDAVPDPAGIVKPYPDDYDIGIDDDELLLFAGVWSPRTRWDGDNFFLVESDVPVILNRLTAGSASGLNWGVPWGVSVIVKTDCGNGTTLEDEIELEIDPVVSTGMADVNGASIPKISILAALGEVDVQDSLVAESRMGNTDHGNDDYFKHIASSEFSHEYACWSQIGECVPKTILGSNDRPIPVDTTTAVPAAAANADTGRPISTMIDGAVPASTPDSNAVTIDTEGPAAAAATDGPVGSPVATSAVTDDPSTASSAFSAKRITTSFLLGLVTTASLLILGTVGIAFDKTSSRSTMLGVSAIAVFAAMILAILPPPAHSLSSSSGAYESIRSLNTNHEDHHNHQCAVTVEIVYSGCDHQVYIDAPGATLRNSVDTSESNWDTCECKETHTFVDANPGDETNADDDFDVIADDDFSVIPESFNIIYQDTIVNEIGESSTVYRVAGGNGLGFLCNIAVGRPYRDSSGNAVSASLCEAATEHKTSENQYDKSQHKMNQPWSEPSLSFLSSSRNPPQRLGGDHSRTNWNEHEQPRLGAEWTHRALGEHASIASFAAFALALMSNQAPPDLIRDALTAAQDELRHAKVSFEIASMLSGVVVEPTALPPSTLQFGANRTELALATAREGCIEETLSAIELAVDYDEFVAASDDASSVEEKIMDTTKTIALEEGNHSVLAWRTMKWICSSGDDNTNGNEACEAVQQHVLDPFKLVEAGERRFPSSPRAREIWDCIWKSLLPLISASVDLDMVDENIDGYSSKCPSNGILGNTVRDGDTNSATLSELLAYKIVSKLKPNAATVGANSVYEIN